MNEEYKLVKRQIGQPDSMVKIGRACIGNGNFCVIAGPCTVESETQLMTVAKAVKVAGAGILRGGTYKVRTSPYGFQGLGRVGLELMNNAKESFNMPVTSELIDFSHISMYEDIDLIQIGARSMQNTALLKAVGALGKPVLLKRGMTATIDELLYAAEYLMIAGCQDILLCERGIRTFETATRNTLDLSAVPVLKRKTHLPVIVDPSHATGDSDLVEPMSLAAIAAGADGLMIEVHPNPQEALCDGKQALTIERFSELMEKIKRMIPVMDKRLA